jgi:hypothetical protein
MVMTGGSVEAVVDWILATLLQNNVAKSSADSIEPDGCCCGWSLLLTVFHRARGLFAQASIVADQNAVNFIY